MRDPWTARRSNQSILKEISPEYSLDGLMLKLQYFGHWIIDSLEKTLMLGKIEGRRRRGRQKIRGLDGITDSVDKFEQTPGVADGQGNLMCCSPWGLKELDMTEQLNRLSVITDAITVNLIGFSPHLFCPFVPLRYLFEDIVNQVLFIIQIC